MIYKPNTIYPYGQSIDGQKVNDFKFTFTGDMLLKYQITVAHLSNGATIYSTDIINTTNIYNNTEVVCSIPANKFSNNLDLVWQITMWETSPTMFIVGGATQAGSTTTAVKLRQHPTVKPNMYLSINGQIIKIIAYNYSTGIATLASALSYAPLVNIPYNIYSDFITSSNYPFKSRSTPIVTIVNPPSEITTRKVNLVGSYSQVQNVLIKYHTWNIYDDDGLIYTTGEVYNSNLSLEFDGLSADQYYKAELIVVNQDNVQANSAKCNFHTAYKKPNVSVPPQVTIQYDKSAVLVEWTSDKQSIGVTTDGESCYEFIKNFPFNGTNSVYLKSGELYYNQISQTPLEISENQFGVMTSVNLPDGFNGKIIELSSNNGDVYGVKLNNYNFIIYHNSQEIISFNIYPTSKFLLTSTAIAIADVNYIWDDNAIWDDNLIWTENVIPYLSLKQWKITITPNSILITEAITPPAVLSDTETKMVV